MDQIHPALEALAVPLSSVVALPGNPRRGDVEAVKRSYLRFGQRKPIVVRRSDMAVTAGNHQRLAAIELGWDRIAAVVVDDDDATSAAFALADNKTSDLGTYDPTDLLAMLQSVNDAGDPETFEATGFSTEGLLAMIAAAQPVVRLTDPDAVPEAPVVPVSKLGDVWVLGEHRVVCGSALDAGAYTALLGADLADCVWTDPPYGVSVASRIGTKSVSSAEARKLEGDRGIMNDEMTIPDLTVFLRDTLSLALAVTSQGGGFYVAAPHAPIGLAFSSALSSLGVWKSSLVWVKNSLVMGRADYHWRHEPIYYGWAPGASHRWYSDRAQDTVLEFDRPSRSVEHPTMKPVALIEYCLTNSSQPGDLILDPFAGSGSTLLAAHSLSRKARLIELDPRYVDVICRRFQEHAGIVPVLEATGEPHDFTS